MFWKAETEGFSTIQAMNVYVDTVNTGQGSLMHSVLSMLKQPIHSLVQYTSHVMVCMSMQSTQSNCNVDSNTKALIYSKVRFKALIYFELEQTSN